MTLPAPSWIAGVGASVAVQIYGRTRGADEVRIVEGSLTDRRLIALYARRGRICAAAGSNKVRAPHGHRAQVADAAVIEVGCAA
ncbi:MULTISPECIES: hypothetical protein [Streptomyces]|uniref:hypothetical protein n=1 Tax=Streptomyces TaxID=1883 RepID=UPI0018F0C860|nr:hypothetical protein [Streptomyces sp. CRPSP2-6A1]MBJ7005674.1 hypothetical protein [Streptomyces sp. CRPSP2-6A1]